jgi:hypothetical protein
MAKARHRRESQGNGTGIPGRQQKGNTMEPHERLAKALDTPLNTPGWLVQTAAAILIEDLEGTVAAMAKKIETLEESPVACPADGHAQMWRPVVDKARAVLLAGEGEPGFYDGFSAPAFVYAMMDKLVNLSITLRGEIERLNKELSKRQELSAAADARSLAQLRKRVDSVVAFINADPDEFKPHVERVASSIGVSARSLYKWAKQAEVLGLYPRYSIHRCAVGILEDPDSIIDLDFYLEDDAEEDAKAGSRGSQPDLIPKS